MCVYICLLLTYLLIYFWVVFLKLVPIVRVIVSGVYIGVSVIWETTIDGGESDITRLRRWILSSTWEDLRGGQVPSG